MFPHGKDYLILRERRVTSGLTQQQVADKAGVKLQQYQKFESGERNLRTASFQIACKVLEALDLDIVISCGLRSPRTFRKRDGHIIIAGIISAVDLKSMRLKGTSERTES